MRIIDAVAKKLKIPKTKLIATVDKHANTSSASIPLAMDLAISENKIVAEQIILLAAFGGGLTTGGVLLRF